MIHQEEEQKTIEINKAFNFWHQLIDWLQEDQERLYEINLTGSRLSGKTIGELIFCIMAMELLDFVVNIFFFRYEPKGAKESWDEFLGVCSLFDIDTTNKNGFNHTNKEWKHKKNKIKFIGFKSNEKKAIPKLGLARGIEKTITIRVIDEIYEFNHPGLISIIDQAVGGAKQIVKINSTNPWSIQHWYIQYINDFHPYNKYKMKTIGMSTKSVWVDNRFKLSSQTNHRVNQYLSDIQHYELIDSWNIDPFQASIVDLGIPGIVRGSIYARLIHKIRDPRNISPKNRDTIFEGGVDWGESDLIGGSGTAFIMGRASKNNNWETADFEYHHRNSTSLIIKTQEQMVQEMIATYIKGFKSSYDYKFVKEQGGVNIYVDNAAVGISNLLKAELHRQDPKIAIITNINYCVKWTRDERVKVKKYQMGSGELFIDFVRCPELFKQYQNTMYDEDKLPDEEVPVKDADDCMDAMDYKSCQRTRKITKNKTFKLMYGGARNIWN